MLKINKTRQTTAQFFAIEGELEKLVKTTTVNTDNNAVSTIYETMHDAELYAKHRTDMRADEEVLRELRYKIEDDILAELTEASSTPAE
jgi:aspartate/tyrosine/aromatic aminotransferase